MCKISKMSAVLALALVGLCAGSARAGDLVVKVPFPFVVGHTEMPAGEYLVERVGADPYVMVIKAMSLHHPHAAVFFAEPTNGDDPAGDKPALTFSHRENEYRLSSVWQSGSTGEQVWGS